MGFHKPTLPPRPAQRPFWLEIIVHLLTMVLVTMAILTFLGSLLLMGLIGAVGVVELYYQP